MKVLFSGDRWWIGWKSIANRLDLLDPSVDEVIVGDAKGVDDLVYVLAKEKGFKVNVANNGERYKAHWNEHGRAAGVLRNIEMLNLQPDMVIAFHPDLDKSKGTRHCVNEAKKRGIPVEIHNA